MRSPRGITLRITLLGWLVTLITLAVFVMVIVPEQKREFELNLESKARGVAASIKGVAAGAAMSEDYSVVVDQAMQVLSGDQAIDFLIITKNDGFSVVTDRSKWKTETLGVAWRPATRAPSRSIGTEPLFGRRVFHYATPFDYSGIQWGWIHVGLSLDSYDQSVRRTYRRTGALALLCVGMSLLISLIYAKRLVKPIRVLHAAVAQVAQGNLHARAEVRSRDEIEQLAKAFNVMATTILARNQILESVGFAAQELLSATEWTAVVEEVLESIGRATGTSRAYVFENATHDGILSCSLRYEWLGPDVAATRDRWQHFPWQGGGLDHWAEQLKSRQVVTAKPAEMEEGARALLDPEIKSLISVPIFVGDLWWGFLGFDDCGQEREWGDAEKDSLGAVANMLGASIMRQRAQDDLIDAKATLECRVIERTHELQEQVAARDRAHAELAAAQQRLVELSRQAGMAEVATGVLHNVGNVLNSVNVAATIALEKLQRSRVEKLVTVAGLLQEHEGDLGLFVREDSKGGRVLPYLTKLAQHLVQEKDGMMSELAQLSRHVDHIKEIVAAQQSYATTAGFVERVSIAKLMEDALAISKDGMERDDVLVQRHFAEIPDVLTDKHKVLQIVLNLLRNARDATKASGRKLKEIHVHLRPAGPDRLQIEVSDNGIGLGPDDLQRVFQHGFTTKKGGHGFGLHSGALAAGELRGRLTASSEGPGRGATFLLDLPLQVHSSSERPGARTNSQQSDRHGGRSTGKNGA
ncbi:MAG: ATP-binding protein [Bryobacteraceae bacterium]